MVWKMLKLLFRVLLVSSIFFVVCIFMSNVHLHINTAKRVGKKNRAEHRENKTRSICDTGENGLSSRVDVLLMIPTSANEQSQRMAIRQTYASLSGNNTRRVRYVFTVGVANNETNNAIVMYEQTIYSDIVRLNVTDTYLNLTLKVILGLEWAVTFCGKAKYVMKLDTDSWLNVHKLLFLLSTPNFSLRNKVGGAEQYGAVPNRNPNHKWYVSMQEYPNKTYPRYASGPGYIMPIKVAGDVVRVSKAIPRMSMEDVYIGMCLRALKYSTKGLRGFFPYKVTSNPCHLNRYIVVHRVTPKEMISAWSCKAQRNHSRDRSHMARAIASRT